MTNEFIETKPDGTGALPFSVVAFLGTVLASSWLNFILYSLELVSIFYYVRCMSPHHRIKFLLYVSLAFDSLCTWATSVNTYMYLVMHAFPPQYPMRLWPTPIWTITNNMAIFLCQSFFAYRYWTLTAARSITIVLAVGIALQLIFGIIATVWTAVDLNGVFDFSLTATVIFNVCSAFTDILIMVAMITKIRTMEAMYQSTKNLLRLVSLYTLAGGAATAAVTICTAVTFSVNTTVSVPFLYCIGRVYTLSMVANLVLVRQQNRRSTIHTLSDAAEPRPAPVPLTTIRFTESLVASQGKPRPMQLGDGESGAGTRTSGGRTNRGSLSSSSGIGGKSDNDRDSMV